MDKLEKVLLKIEDAKGSNIKLMKLEIDFLSLVEQARDTMMGCIQNPDDKDRKELIHIFGGDCVRISRMRAYLEAAKLSEKNATDQRLPSCLSTCDIIERVLIEKGFSDNLRESNARFIPFAPRNLGQGGAGESAGYTAPKPAPKPPPAPQPPMFKKGDRVQMRDSEDEPWEEGIVTSTDPLTVRHADSDDDDPGFSWAEVRCLPAPEPAPAPKPQPKPEPPSQASVKNVVTSSGTGFEEVAPDVPRSITITAKSELDPEFDFCTNGTMVMEMDGIKVRLLAESEPAWPSSAKPFEKEQEFFISIPEVANVVFDPSAKTPPEGRVQAIAHGEGTILTIPEGFDIGVKCQTMSPYGHKALLHGSNETQLQYTVEVNMRPAPAIEDGAQVLKCGLTITFTAWLTGHGSAKFQPDGNPVASPER